MCGKQTLTLGVQLCNLLSFSLEMRSLIKPEAKLAANKENEPPICACHTVRGSYLGLGFHTVDTNSVRPQFRMQTQQVIFDTEPFSHHFIVLLCKYLF